MMKILAHVMVAASLSVLFGCSAPALTHRNMAVIDKQPLEFSPHRDRYCFKDRGAILAVDVSMPEGWPTAQGHDVELSQVHDGAITHCKAQNPPLIAEKDTLWIHDVAGARTLGFTHDHGAEQTFKLFPAEGLARGQANLWYQTSPGPSDKYQYFVYMLDKLGPTGKEQWYKLEIFDLSDTQCLAEIPTIGKMTPDTVEPYLCKDGGFDQNGTGSGYEPK